MGVCWQAGASLVLPVRHDVGPPPAGAETFLLKGESGALHGWLSTVPHARGVVILMHCVRCDRRTMAGRIPFLNRAGYHAIAFDFQAHGESAGKAITFGAREASDARTVVAWARQRFAGLPVAAIGFSLGGASALLGEAPLDVDALVVEAVYPSIETATQNRLRARLGDAGAQLAPLLLWQLAPRLGVSAAQLAPVERIEGVHVPLLVMSGSADAYTTPADTAKLFQRANAPKQLWMVPGAGHQDLHAYAAADYEHHVLAFLEQALKHERAMPSTRFVF